MSELNVNDLRKMNLKSLKEYAKELTGEDLDLVNSVINEKEGAKTPIATDPGVAAEKELSEEGAAEKAKAREAREAARLEKENNRLKIEEERAAKAEERNQARLKAIKEKEEAKAKKLEAEAVIKAEKAEKVLAREKAKAEREEKKKAEIIARAEKKEAAIAARAARAEELKAALSDVEITPQMSKTDVVREYLKKGMSNPEIALASGYGIKFVCDTVWRIRQQLQVEEIRKRIVAEREAERAAKAEADNAEQAEADTDNQ